MSIAAILLLLAVICFAAGAARVQGPEWLCAGLAFVAASLLVVAL